MARPAKTARHGSHVVTTNARRKKASTPRPAAGPPTDAAVAAFLRGLEHPLKQELEAVRRLILAASPTIHEGIKWNAPSFRTDEYFATMNLRARNG
jgi:hypothetical protein